MADSTISKQLVQHVAKLAKLELTDEQIDIQTKSLVSIMEYMAEIRNIDVSAVGGTSRVTEEENIFRDDIVKPSLAQQEALHNASWTHEGYFVVPAIFNSEDN